MSSQVPESLEAEALSAGAADALSNPTPQPEISSRSRYVRGVATLLAGSTVSQAIPILAAPILTRFFHPAEFGAAATFASAVALMAVVVASQYTHAIMLARVERDAVNLLALCLTIALAFSVALQLVFLVAGDPIARLFDLSANRAWIHLIPLAVLLNGAYASLTVWASRAGNYSRLAISRVAQNVVINGLQLILGALGAGVSGLLIGMVAGLAVSTAALAYQTIRDDRSSLRLISWRWMKAMSWTRRRFAIYLVPADLMNGMANQAPIMLLSSLAGAGAVGFYSLAQRVLALPASLVGASVVEVFKREAIVEWESRGECVDVFRTTLKVLAGLSILPTLAIMLVGPYLFGLVFGAKWYEAGLLARAVAPMIFLRFVVSPLTYVYYIANRQREDLLLHVYLVGSTIATMIITYRVTRSAVATVTAFSINYGLVYVIYLIRSYQLAKGVGRAHEPVLIAGNE